MPPGACLITLCTRVYLGACRFVLVAVDGSAECRRAIKSEPKLRRRRLTHRNGSRISLYDRGAVNHRSQRPSILTAQDELCKLRSPLMKWKDLFPRQQPERVATASSAFKPMEYCAQDDKQKDSSRTTDSAGDDTSLSTSSNDSGHKKRSPPAKPPRRRHSVSSLKGSDPMGSLRKTSATKTLPRFASGAGDGQFDNTPPRTDPVHWILDPPPSFGGSAGPPSLDCGRTYEGNRAVPVRGDTEEFRSLPLSISLVRKSNTQGNRAAYSPFARTTPPVAVRDGPRRDPPTPDRDVPDVVSRSVAATPHRQHCGGRHCGPQPASAPGRLTVPNRPRRTNSDPVIHLDETEEDEAHAGILERGLGVRKSARGCREGSGGNVGGLSRTADGFVPEEMEALKKINAKLWNQVQHLHSQLELLRRVRNPEKSSLTSPSGTTFADLLSDIYYAQQERDGAMHDRLAAANDGRDLAVKELHKFAGNYSSDDATSDEEDDALVLSGLDKVLHGLETSRAPTKLLRHRETLVATVRHLRDRRGRLHRSDLRALQAERDLALEKVKVLEKELQEMHMKAIWKSENWAPTVVDTLQQVTNERNAALGKLQELQDSLSQAHNGGRDRTTSELARMSSEAQTEFVGGSSADAEGLRTLKEEVERIGTRLESEILSRQNAEVRCQKLEELVSGFQKRINGVSSDSSSI